MVPIEVPANSITFNRVSKSTERIELKLQANAKQGQQQTAPESESCVQKA